MDAPDSVERKMNARQFFDGVRKGKWKGPMVKDVETLKEVADGSYAQLKRNRDQDIPEQSEDILGVLDDIEDFADCDGDCDNCGVWYEEETEDVL